MKRIYMLAALLLATGCASKQERRTVAPMRVETLVVAPSSETESSRYVGTIEEERSVALSFPLAGTLARIEVDEGEYVTRGAVVAELDPTSARQSYAAAEATFEQNVCGSSTRPTACPKSSGSRLRPGCSRHRRPLSWPARIWRTAPSAHPLRGWSASGRPKRARPFCRVFP